MVGDLKLQTKKIGNDLKRREVGLFDLFNVILMLCLLVITLWPFWSQVVISLTGGNDVYSNTYKLWPTNFSLDAYKIMLNLSLIWTGFKNSIIRVICGTTLGMVFTILTAYPLSKKHLPFHKFFSMFLIFTMIFNGGMIPNYLLIRNLGIYNTLWALILPGLLSAWNVMILRNFFMSIPSSLEESAHMDGASQLTILLRIILPLSKPALATISLWIGVHLWNEWFNAMIYVEDTKNFVLQYVLRNYIEIGRSTEMDSLMQQMSSGQKPTSVQLEAAMVMLIVVPMLVIYPFIQKYFTKGIMVGAVKG